MVYLKRVQFALTDVIWRIIELILDIKCPAWHSYELTIGLKFLALEIKNIVYSVDGYRNALFC